MSNPNDSAYPTGQQEVVFEYDPATGMSKPRTFIVPQGGMTIRQQFVMAAMQGLCANPELIHHAHDVLARWAVEGADATLAEEARTRSKA